MVPGVFYPDMFQPCWRVARTREYLNLNQHEHDDVEDGVGTMEHKYPQRLAKSLAPDMATQESGVRCTPSNFA
jgi:hypothetical protein